MVNGKEIKGTLASVGLKSLAWIVPIAIVLVGGAIIYRNYLEIKILKQEYKLNKVTLVEKQTV